MLRYSNLIESVGLRKCPYYRYLIEKVTSTDVRITNISQSLPHKMAENSWYEEITSLSPYVWMSLPVAAISVGLLEIGETFRLSAEGASVERRRLEDRGAEGATPPPQWRRGLARGRCPLPRNFFSIFELKRRVLVHSAVELNGNWLRPPSGMHALTGEFW